MIYDLALLQPGSTSMTKDPTENSTFILRWNEPKLLQVSKQVRDEALPLYYLSQAWEFTIRYFETKSLHTRLTRLVNKIGAEWPHFVVRRSQGKTNTSAALALTKLAYASIYLSADGQMIQPRMTLKYNSATASGTETQKQAHEHAIYKTVERAENAKADGVALKDLPGRAA